RLLPAPFRPGRARLDRSVAVPSGSLPGFARYTTRSTDTWPKARRRTAYGRPDGLVWPVLLALPTAGDGPVDEELGRTVFATQRFLLACRLLIQCPEVV